MEFSASDHMWFYGQAIMEDPGFIQSHWTGTHGYELGDLQYQALTTESCLSYHHHSRLCSSIDDEQKTDVLNNYTPAETKPFKPPPPAASSNYSSSQIISFQDSNELADASGQVGGGNYMNVRRERSIDDETCRVVALISEGLSYDQGDKYFKEHRKVAGAATTRSPQHTQDHVMAERKRREKLNQRFFALSAVLPSSKKLYSSTQSCSVIRKRELADSKATVLEDAINYLRKLEERVRNLEEQTAVQIVECAVLLKRSPSSCVENLDSYMQLQDSSLPDIEARVSDKDVLIKIHCENHRGCVAKILNELEKLHLSIHKTSVLPFGNSMLDITIVARMNVEYCLTSKDLVRNLRKGIVHDFM